MNGETDAEQRIERKINLNAQAGSPIVADLNKDDNRIELLVTTNDGILHCLSGMATGIEENDGGVPLQFGLNNNYPNPFNPATTVNYTIAQPCNVSLIIYNMLGQKVKILVNKFQNGAGKYTVHWNGRDDRGKELPSGLYVATLRAGNYRKSIKILKMK